MIQIENISVKEEYSISLWFNRDYTKENIIFGEERAKQDFFRNNNSEIYEKVIRKSNFGRLIEDGLEFAESDKLREVRSAVNGLIAVLKQGKGLREIEPYKTELFRVYNGTENIFEQYIILKLWHEFLKKHKEVNTPANTMRKRQWEQIGITYEGFADKMLMPFENKYVSADDIKGFSGEARIETLVTDKVVEYVFTFDKDIMPLYVIYLTELTRRGKHIRTCEICGRKFVASRKDTRVCSQKCKAQRQSGYFKEHKEKVKDDTLEKLYQNNRDGYDNFLKKLKKQGAADEIAEPYRTAKYAFLDEGKKKRRAFRKGELSKKELREWIEADRLKRFALESEISKLLQKGSKVEQKSAFWAV